MTTYRILSSALPSKPFGRRELVYRTAFDKHPPCAGGGLPFFSSLADIQDAETRKQLATGALSLVEVRLKDSFSLANCWMLDKGLDPHRRQALQEMTAYQAPFHGAGYQGALRDRLALGHEVYEELASYHGRIAANELLRAVGIDAVQSDEGRCLINPDMIVDVSVPHFDPSLDDEKGAGITWVSVPSLSRFVVPGANLIIDEKRNYSGSSSFVYRGKLRGHTNVFVKQDWMLSGTIEEYLTLQTAAALGLPVAESCLFLWDAMPTLMTRAATGQLFYDYQPTQDLSEQFKICRLLESYAPLAAVLDHKDYKANVLVRKSGFKMIDMGIALRRDLEGVPNTHFTGDDLAWYLDLQKMQDVPVLDSGAATLNEKIATLNKAAGRWPQVERALDRVAADVAALGVEDPSFSAATLKKDVLPVLKERHTHALHFLSEQRDLRAAMRMRFSRPNQPPVTR